MKKLLMVCTAAFLGLAVSSCGGDEGESGKEGQDSTDQVQVPVNQLEPHTYGNIDEIYSTHLHLDLNVDFDRKVLTGSVTHDVVNEAGTDKMVFDTDHLRVTKVVLDEKDETPFSFGQTDSLLGTPLIVDVKPETKKVTIFYETAPDNSNALQWLNPQQTAGKKHPYLFTQGQAILTRSWIPVQDSPYKRITYSARLEVPSELMAVMSADKEQMQASEDGVYEFDMDIPIPCYLIAMAVGDLEFRPVGPRTGVYAESAMIDRSAAELEDMEKMVEACEDLYGEYKWGRYDVIVLPPSFPFGGMENPKLTFATPTIIAGDKSLVSLIAHELAHSWSGNLVTNATWDDFWLNEGVTVYIENRIMEAVYGKDHADMLAELEMNDLKQQAADIEAGKLVKDGIVPGDTKLKLHLHGRNPDDGMTDIAYNKGAYFLRTLENTYGRERFDEFLKGYFADHEFQTISTEEFVEYLKENLIEPSGIPFDYEAWIYNTGIPSNVAKRESANFDKMDRYLAQLAAGKSIRSLGLKQSDFATQGWQYFIYNLPENVDAEGMKEIDEVFGFKSSGNSEIQGAWYVQAVKRGYHGADQEIEAFLINVGRRKFLSPLYSAMAATPEGRKWALRIYEKARPNYHSVSFNSIDNILDYQAAE